MIKKFFAAMILAVFMFSAQIAAAADYDWNKVQRVRNEAELCRYIEKCRRKGLTTFPVVFTNGFTIERIKDSYVSSDGKRHCHEFADFIEVADIKFNGNWNKNGTELFLNCNIGELPGTKVANAYLSNQPDMAWKNLNYEERLLYSKALKIVSEANKRSSKEDKARYIYEELRKIRTREGGYYTSSDKFTEDGKLKPFATAIGVLNNGQANCGGYTDAFYMLCRMAGLSMVGKIGGYVNNEGKHAWNTIDFGDGKVYFVDVTYGNGFFKVTTEELRKKGYRWHWNTIPNLQ